MILKQYSCFLIAYYVIYDKINLSAVIRTIIIKVGQLLDFENIFEWSIRTRLDLTTLILYS